MEESGTLGWWGWKGHWIVSLRSDGCHDANRQHTWRMEGQCIGQCLFSERTCKLPMGVEMELWCVSTVALEATWKWKLWVLLDWQFIRECVPGSLCKQKKGKDQPALACVHLLFCTKEDTVWSKHEGCWCVVKVTKEGCAALVELVSKCIERWFLCGADWNWRRTTDLQLKPSTINTLCANEDKWFCPCCTWIRTHVECPRWLVWCFCESWLWVTIHECRLLCKEIRARWFLPLLEPTHICICILAELLWLSCMDICFCGCDKTLRMKLSFVNLTFANGVLNCGWMGIGQRVMLEKFVRTITWAFFQGRAVS